MEGVIRPLSSPTSGKANNWQVNIIDKFASPVNNALIAILFVVFKMKDFFLKENVTFNDGNYANKILFAVCKKLKVSFKNMSVLTQPS